MIKRLLTIILILSSVISFADQVKFEMSAPNAVQIGQQFRLSFSINEQGKNLKLPDLSNFDVLMGPSTSQSTNFQSINGRVSQSVTYSYIYILRAKTEGSFDIRPGSIEVDGKVYESNSLKIRVVKGQPQQQAQQNNQQGGSVNISKDDLFVRVSFSKRNVYRGEQIIATVKLYAEPSLPIQGFEEVNLPEYEGFYTQDIDMPQQISFEREVYNEKIYKVGLLKKTILFPQQNGTITIDPFSLTCLVQQQTRQRSFFDDFFSNMRTVRAKINSLPVSVNVKDLPSAPASFYGGVGSFNVNASMSETEVSTNDAVTLKVTINGSGNIRLIQNPVLELPTDFEVYDPRSTENVRSNDNGMSGTKTIEYLFQPRFEGDYTIPSIGFSYFNPASGQYTTRATPEFELHVVKGDEEQSATVISSLRKEDVQLIGQDIRFIKSTNSKLKQKGFTFFGTTGFYSVYGASSLAFLLLFLVYRKKARENANIALMRNKKANRIAKKHLREAAGFMKNNQDEQFYESILKAFWGYLSDKLGIAVADLNRDRAVEELQNREVEKEQVDGFVVIIEQCEFARYSPTRGSKARQELYSQAESVMSKIERQIKR
ncbi:MAG: protein BatD [Mariniphaga sp.]|nr:protein BatD [Mariniphaga sp.]